MEPRPHQEFRVSNGSAITSSIEQSQPESRSLSSGSQLCATCQQLDLSINDFLRIQTDGRKGGYLGREDKYIGFYDEIMERTYCPLCRLVARAVCNEPTYGLLSRGGMQRSSTRYKIYLHTKVAGGCMFAPQSPYTFWLFIKTEPEIEEIHHWWSFLVMLGESAPPAVSDILLARRLEPQIDIACIRRWLGECTEQHKKCSKPWWVEEERSESLSTFRVIDVHEQRVVWITRSKKYAALSYVWGTTAPFRATKANMVALEQEGGLRSVASQIPKTILDAMRLVEDLGESYLWVDSLCLVQDDDIGLLSMIEKMDVIYSNAHFAIVAASGGNANDGLAGLYQQRGKERQYIEEVRPNLYVALCEDVELQMLKSKYETRAWTYVLSCYLWNARHLKLIGVDDSDFKNVFSRGGKSSFGIQECSCNAKRKPIVKTSTKDARYHTGILV